jgi:mannose-6-phosphate isomerase-like protein (cupin superfamily)
MSIQHFVTHLDEVIPYTGDASYVAKRLVHYPIGASGYIHGTLLLMPPGTKVLSHWHDDREAMFVCVGGTGRFALDELEREVRPGIAMLQPFLAVHGFQATGDEEFRFLDLALFADHGADIAPENCFVDVEEVTPEPTGFGERRPYFPPETYGNPAIRFVGEYRIRPGGVLTEADRPAGTETIMLAIGGTGELDLLGRRMPVTPGSVHYLIRDLPFTIRSTGPEPLRYITGSSLPGRYLEPPLFDRLRAGAH